MSETTYGPEIITQETAPKYTEPETTIELTELAMVGSFSVGIETEVPVEEVETEPNKAGINVEASAELPEVKPTYLETSPSLEFNNSEPIPQNRPEAPLTATETSISLIDHMGSFEVPTDWENEIALLAPTPANFQLNRGPVQVPATAPNPAARIESSLSQHNVELAA